MTDTYDSTGIHEAHCCVLHGCKYNDENCPVINKKVDQAYLCESCFDEGIESLEQLNGLVDKEEQFMAVYKPPREPQKNIETLLLYAVMEKRNGVYVPYKICRSRTTANRTLNDPNMCFGDGFIKIIGAARFEGDEEWRVNLSDVVSIVEPSPEDIMEEKLRDKFSEMIEKLSEVGIYREDLKELFTNRRLCFELLQMKE